MLVSSLDNFFLTASKGLRRFQANFQVAGCNGSMQQQKKKSICKALMTNRGKHRARLLLCCWHLAFTSVMALATLWASQF